MYVVELDITDAFGEIRRTIQLSFVSLIVVSGISEVQVDFVNLLDYSIEIVLESTMGDVESLVHSDFDESLKSRLGGYYSGD